MNFLSRSWSFLTVGPTSIYQFRSIREALDSITDSAWDNPYLIEVSHLHRAGSGAVPHGGCWIDRSHVALVGGPGCLIDRPDGDIDPDPAGGVSGLSGGTLHVGQKEYANDLTFPYTKLVDVGLYDLTVRRNGQGGPPEAALFIGGRDYQGAITATRQWDYVTVAGNRLIGEHDALQWFGLLYGATDSPPNLRVHGNDLICTHDASTNKGSARVTHSHNRIVVRSQGSEYLDVVEQWKSTGIHINIGFPAGSDFETGNAHPESFFHSICDVIDVQDGTDVADVGSAPEQSALCGVYIYKQNLGANAFAGEDPRPQPIPPIRFQSTLIYVRQTVAPNEIGFVAGIAVAPAGATSAYDIENEAGRFSVVGSSIEVRQEATAGSPPSDVYGLQFQCGDSPDDKIFHIRDTIISAENAAGSAWSIGSLSNNDEVRVDRVFSDQATQELNGGRVVGLSRLA